MLNIKDLMIIFIAVIIAFGIMYLIQIELPKHMKDEIRCYDIYINKK